MRQQPRAARTRETVLRAAAAEFARHGYAGASLARIAARADVSLGALTFHFSSKAELVQDVLREGCRVTASAVEASRDLEGKKAGPLQELIDLSHRLVSLLARDGPPLAAYRLGQQASWEAPARNGPYDWYAQWLPHVRRLAEQADHTGWLRPCFRAEHVTGLMTYLVPGPALMAPPEARRGRTPTASTARQRLTLAWQLVLPTLTACDDRQESLNPAGPSIA
ncbi:helix-turn-helix domain-containing protein [Streptomyces sp. NPDC002790]|uniref:helix-turn-helix domain-containing protein n=1 Tax=Streptomyces sp. NPDC002790 TaxID=3154431 RepID=UPI003328C6CB